MAYRIEKVRELVKQQLAQLIRQSLSEELGIIIITDVLVAPDLKSARVYISTIEPANQKKIFKLLEDKKFEFQHILGKKLSMRFTPKLEFKKDESLAKINEVEKILENI